MKFILLSSFLFTQIAGFGQRVHELKADIYFPIFKGMNFSYEFVPARRLGIEISLRYQWGLDGYVYSYSPGDSYYEDLSGDRVAGFLLAFKYYLTKHNGERWYAGAYYRDDFWVSGLDRTTQYKASSFDIYDDWMSYYSSSSSYKRNIRSAFGILAGYKHCFGRHFVLDLSLGADTNLYALFNRYYPYAEVLLLPSIKTGYRW